LLVTSLNLFPLKGFPEVPEYPALLPTFQDKFGPASSDVMAECREHWDRLEEKGLRGEGIGLLPA
jgi:hypothetical protein